MNVALPTPGFNIGSGGPMTEAKSLVDMSLDDLIKARRTETKEIKQKKKTEDTEKKATNAKKDAIVQKSIGTSKAKRNAKTAAKRGLAKTAKASEKEIGFEVDRQKRQVPDKDATSNETTTTTPRKSGRRKNARTAADKKIKAKNTAEKTGKAVKKKQTEKTGTSNHQTQPVKAPTKKAMNAAIKAMTSAGFTAPEGMKMVISFTPIENNTQSKKKQNEKSQAQQKGTGNGKGRKGRGSR